MEYIGKVPCYSTLMIYFNDKRLQRILQELITLSALPVKDVEEHFSVDSSGFSTSKFGRWFDHKYGEETERRIYRKAHITIGTKTNIVTSAIITEQNFHDSPFFEPLIKKTALHFNIKEVSADKGYSSRENCEIVAELGAVPYIPFRSNATGKAMGSLVWRKMFEFSKVYPQEFLEIYHKRSNVESTFNMIKAKFDDCLMTKNFTANTNEILCKLLCHNLCCLISAYFELGIKASFCTKAPKLTITAIK
jgi:transposase